MDVFLSGVVELHHIALIHFIPLFLLKSLYHFYKHKKFFSLTKYVGICVSKELHEWSWEVSSGRVEFGGWEGLHHFPAGIQVIFSSWVPGSPWAVVSRRLLIPRPELRTEVYAGVVAITMKKAVREARGGSTVQRRPCWASSLGLQSYSPPFSSLLCAWKGWPMWTASHQTPCLLAFSWVQSMGGPGRRSEDGKREARVFLSHSLHAGLAQGDRFSRMKVTANIRQAPPPALRPERGSAPTAASPRVQHCPMWFPSTCPTPL